MNKRLISSPAQSSEYGPPSHGDAYEQELIWQHYTNTIQASKILNLDLDKIDNLAKSDLDQNQDITNNFKKSHFIIINQYNKENKENYFFIIIFYVFYSHYFLIIQIIEKKKLCILQPLFSDNTNLTFCFLSNSQYTFSKQINIGKNNCEFNQLFKDEIYNFNSEFILHDSSNNETSEIIISLISCITGYLKEVGIYHFFTKRQLLMKIINCNH